MTGARAAEMPVPWKSKNDFHRTLETPRADARASHISTAHHPRIPTEKTDETTTGCTSD